MVTVPLWDHETADTSNGTGDGSIRPDFEPNLHVDREIQQEAQDPWLAP